MTKYRFAVTMGGTAFGAVLAACATVTSAEPIDDQTFPWADPVVEEISGKVALEGRIFPYPERFFGQDRHSASLVFEPEYYVEWDDYTSLTVAPFLRLDSADSERTHADLREFLLRIVRDDWELGLGAGRVFWGVAESRHLVDIINQTDVVENIDLEDKLGQPMVELSLVQDWGFVNLYYLPYFRDRTFQGRGGRLRSQLLVDEGQTT